MKMVLKYLGIFALAVLISFLFAEITGRFYETLFQEGGSTWSLDLGPVIGFMLNYTFFVPFLFSLLGTSKNYYWIAGFLVPIILFEIFSSFTRFWLFALLVLLGWGLGYGIRKIFDSLKSKTI